VSPIAEEIHQFVLRLVSTIVDYPDAVKVSILESGSMIVVELNTDARDMGKVIGKSGRMAQSMRILLTAIATKHKYKAVYQILGE
jgi:uncharacterized protein